jgi:hypothetical protein
MHVRVLVRGAGVREHGVGIRVRVRVRVCVRVRVRIRTDERFCACVRKNICKGN